MVINKMKECKLNEKGIQFMYILLILSIVFLESVAHYNIKRSKIDNNVLFMIVAVLCYFFICILLNKCYDFDGMGKTNFLWSVLSIVIILLLGNFIFDEKITNYDFIGLILCIIGLYFIFIHEH
jgi:multidrug transporter EmrE-like cation transporter